MADDKMYIGNGRKGKFESINVQLDLTKLWEYTQGEAKSRIKEWKDKNGKVHKSIDLQVSPLKPEHCTEYQTHSVKINTYEKPEQKQEDQTPF